MQSKGVGKFCFKQFGCNKRLDLLAVDVLNGDTRSGLAALNDDTVDQWAGFKQQHSASDL